MIKVLLTYNVPYEVDLETDINLQDLIKADALVQFKKAVNQEIATLINSNKANITSVSAGTTLADTIGTLIANNIIRLSIFNQETNSNLEILFKMKMVHSLLQIFKKQMYLQCIM